MPVWLRDILIWNPVLQGIEFVRFNYFHEPAPEWLNIKYLAGFAIGSVAIGLIMERMMRRRMLDVE
jgi:capsular polysaccharide transport system permease protein